MIPPLPPNETERLDALHRSLILDTPPEEAYDDIARLAACLCDTPIAAITLIDSERQWFKSSIGLEVQETSREDSFCAHTILASDLLIAPDTRQDERFAENPYVLDEPYIRFYAGVPLTLPNGAAIGSLCVMDTVPKELTLEQQAALRLLARQAVGRITQNAQSSRVLPLSEEIFRAAFSHTVIGMAVADLQAHYLFVNPAFCSITGYTEQEVLASDMAALTHPDDLAANLALIESLQAGEIPSFVLEKRYIHKDGSIVWVRNSVSLTRDAYNQQVNMVLLVEDITQQKHAEEARRKSEAKYRRLAESGIIGVHVWEMDGRLTWVNDQFLEMTGYTHRDLEAGRLRWDRMTPPEWEEATEESLRRIRRTGAFEPYEKEFFRKDGSRVPVLLGGARLEDGTGGVSFVLDLTRQKQAETSLQKEQERFRSLVEGLGAGLLMTDFNDTIQYANPRMAEITGYAPEEMVGQRALELLLSPADQEAMHRHNRDRSRGTAATYEIEIRRQDGTRRWLEVHAVPFRGPSGEVVGTLSTNTDISDRIEAQTALRESERRLRLALEDGQLGWWHLDVATGQYLEFSDRCKAHFGLPPDAPLCYTDFQSLIHPEDRARVDAAAQAALEGRETYAAEYRVVWPDGSVHWLNAHGTPTRDEPTGAVRLIGVTQDVTKRRTAEESLRARTELLESVLAAIPHQVFWKDGNSVYLGCNAPFAEAAGLASPAEVVGKSDSDLAWTPEEAETYREADRRVLESGRAIMDMEEHSRHADGRVTVSLTSKMPLHDAQGRVIGVLGVSQDVTERKAMEAETERLLAETERLLAEAHARADRDPLTNLLNHRAFHTRLAEEAARAEREGTVLAVVVIDLDNFRFFNDVYGHAVGDDVLRLVTARLQQVCRSYDVVARFGGDEFALLLPNAGHAPATEVEARLRANLGGLTCRPDGSEIPIPITVSIGAALFTNVGQDRYRVLRLADERLLRAKTGADAEVGGRSGADPHGGDRIRVLDAGRAGDGG